MLRVARSASRDLHTCAACTASQFCTRCPGQALSRPETSAARSPASCEHTLARAQAAGSSAVPASMLRLGEPAVSRGGVGSSRRRVRAGPGPARCWLASRARIRSVVGYTVSSRLPTRPRLDRVQFPILGPQASPRRRGEGAAPALGFGSGAKTPRRIRRGSRVQPSLAESYRGISRSWRSRTTSRSASEGKELSASVSTGLTVAETPSHSAPPYMPDHPRRRLGAGTIGCLPLEGRATGGERHRASRDSRRASTAPRSAAPPRRVLGLAWRRRLASSSAST